MEMQFKKKKKVGNFISKHQLVFFFIILMSYSQKNKARAFGQDGYEHMFLQFVGFEYKFIHFIFVPVYIYNALVIYYAKQRISVTDFP